MVNLSVKNVPDELADRLRERAGRNRRSLQRELLSILEHATREPAAREPAGHWVEPARADPAARISIEQLAARAHALFAKGTPGSVAFIRQERDQRMTAGVARTGRRASSQR